MKKTKKNEVKQPELPKVDAEMEDPEMEDLLLSLSDSRTWQAYQKYINYRITYAEQALFSVDMFKNPTDAARNQGVRMGLMDLGVYIIELRRLREEKGKGGDAEKII